MRGSGRDALMRLQRIQGLNHPALGHEFASVFGRPLRQSVDQRAAELVEETDSGCTCRGPIGAGCNTVGSASVSGSSRVRGRVGRAAPETGRDQEGRLRSPIQGATHETPANTLAEVHFQNDKANRSL
jgi:hypothetical protein